MPKSPSIHTVSMLILALVVSSALCAAGAAQAANRPDGAHTVASPARGCICRSWFARARPTPLPADWSLGDRG